MGSTEEALEGLLEPPSISQSLSKSPGSSSPSSSGPNPRKRGRVDDENSPEDMMEKITRHCSCTVCLDVPGVALYQCKNGHLMCYTCLNHLLADARMKEEQSTCPNCRCEIRLTQYTNFPSLSQKNRARFPALNSSESQKNERDLARSQD